MAFFDEVKRGLTNTGKQVAKKTKEISDTVQLKAQIAAEKEKAEKLYAEVGKKIFADASEEDNEKYAEEFEAIRKSLEKKKELEDELSGMDGCVYCSECGARIEKNAVFCSKCGVRVKKEEADAPAAEAEEAETVTVEITEEADSEN